MKFPDRTLSNLDLETRMRRLPGWRGVFSRDTVPRLDGPEGFSLILNLQRSDEPGSHWVAVYHEPRGRYVEYFDSFGAPPPEEVVRAKRRRPLLWSSSQLQDVRSSSCGWYAMDFIRARLRGVPFLAYLYRFNQSYADPRAGAQNERLLVRR